MRRQLVPGPVVRLTVIKAKTRPGIEATHKPSYEYRYNQHSRFKWAANMYNVHNYVVLTAACSDSLTIKAKHLRIHYSKMQLIVCA